MMVDGELYYGDPQVSSDENSPRVPAVITGLFSLHYTHNSILILIEMFESDKQEKLILEYFGRGWANTTKLYLGNK